MTEKSLAKKDGAKLQKNSGRGLYQKGDAVLDHYLIDYKEYTSSFTISKKNWEKHASDAWESGHYEPLISVELAEPNGKKIRLAVIDWDSFMMLRGEIGFT